MEESATLETIARLEGELAAAKAREQNAIQEAESIRMTLGQNNQKLKIQMNI